MRVLVLGAGVIGVTTAYYLAREGHEVTVLERNTSAAEETSFANAGLVAPGHAYAWASPKAPAILLKSLFRGDQALRLKLTADPHMWRFFVKFLRQCTSERARINTVRKLRLCRYAQTAFQELVADTGVAYDGQSGGLLYLYRSQASFEAAAAKTAILRDGGQELEVVDRDRVAEIDAALAPVKERFAGAIFAPSDESGDACLFSRALAAHCAERFGVDFRYGTSITAIETADDAVHRVVTDQGNFSAERYVLALGCDSPILGRMVGLSIPLYPVKGYSLTLPVVDRDGGPGIGGVDEDNLVAYAPLGDRLRFTATAEFAGYDRGHRPDDFRGMLAVARDLFPDGADYDRPDYWACLRPMTPQGTPVMGLCRYSNLLLNTGHGHMGWTMACGSGKILADVNAGRQPEIPLDGLTLDQR